MTSSEDGPPPAVGALDQRGRLSGAAENFRRWQHDATDLERVAEDRRGNGTGTQGLRTRRYACSHRPEHISGLVRRPWHEPRP